MENLDAICASEININKYIGSKLREIRVKNKISQTTLGTILGGMIGGDKNTISYQTIKMYEQGKSPFRIDCLCALAKIFQVDIFYFLDLERKIILQNDERDIAIKIPNKNRIIIISIMQNLLNIQDEESLDIIMKIVYKLNS
jgi:transcriptional regulator with XRE-family HTH domain